MRDEAVILCGPERSRARPPHGVVPLVLDNSDRVGNVHLKIQDVRQGLMHSIPDPFLDLIDVAAYVYCADQFFVRQGFDETAEGWRRRLSFHIPVRNPDLWNQELADELVSTLSFLSEDEYHFQFTYLHEPPPSQGYIEFDKSPYVGHVDEVMLFSGGLDSLAGAVQESVVDKRKVLLVNHRSSAKLNTRHRSLLRSLSDRAGTFGPIHIPVRVNKEKILTHEYTQRSRSFLCAALAATVASMVHLDRIRFYENGVVSLNLPPSPQVVGARATRTTHPRVLNAFAGLITKLAGRPFRVENPFLWKTKTDIVRLIAESGCSSLIQDSFSCAKPRQASNEHSHCGECSQCIDRRFAVLAAAQEKNDPAERYATDLLTGCREGHSRTMIVAYVEMAGEISRMVDLDFFSAYGEAMRVLRYVEGGPQSAAAKIWELYRRHANEVLRVIQEGIRRYSSELASRSLPVDCLLKLILNEGPIIEVRDPRPSRPQNVILRRAKACLIGFRGNEINYYPDHIGFDYLAFLLQNPGQTFSAITLDCEVRRRRMECRMSTATKSELNAEVIGFTSGLAGDAILDDEAVKDYGRAIKELDEQIERCQSSGDSCRLDTLEELELKRAKIVSFLNRAFSISGRPIELGSERAKARNRVANPIRRALATIEKFDTALYQHLQRPVLKLGHNVAYDPPDATSWVTSMTELALTG